MKHKPTLLKHFISALAISFALPLPLLFGQQQGKSARPPLCDKHYKAEEIEMNAESETLGDFIKELNDKYHANIVLDPDLADIQIKIWKVRAPWISILRVIMDQNELGKACLKGGIVRIAKRQKLH